MKSTLETPIWTRATAETVDGHRELALELVLSDDASPKRVEHQLQSLLADLDQRYRQLGGSGVTAVNGFHGGNGPYRVRPTNPTDDSRRFDELEECLNLELLRNPTQQECDDYRWVQTDPEVQAKYAGKWVVPYYGEIIASGDLIEGSEVAARARQHLKNVGAGDEWVHLIQIEDDSMIFDD